MNYEEALLKVKKLLALGKSPEPHEAAAALRQAQLMMEKFGIDDDSVVVKAAVQPVRSLVSVSRPADWEAHLMLKLAAAFGCELVWHSSHSNFKGAEVYGQYRFYGVGHKLEPAVYAATVIQRQAYNARAKRRQELGNTLTRAELSKALDGFIIGWVLKALENVLASPISDEERALIEAAKPSVRKKDTKGGKYYARDVEAGRLAAENVSLFQGMSGGEERLRLTGGN